MATITKEWHYFQRSGLSISISILSIFHNPHPQPCIHPTDILLLRMLLTFNMQGDSDIECGNEIWKYMIKHRKGERKKQKKVAVHIAKRRSICIISVKRSYYINYSVVSVIRYFPLGNCIRATHPFHPIITVPDATLPSVTSKIFFCPWK